MIYILENQNYDDQNKTKEVPEATEFNALLHIETTDKDISR